MIRPHSSRNAEGEAWRARVDVGADETEQQPQHDHRHRLEDRAMRQRHRADKPEHHQREIFGSAEFERDPRQRRRKQRDRITVETVPAKNEPIAAVASAGPARPCRAIW